MGLFSLTQELAMDLGTANTLIIHNGKVVVDEPSIVAIDVRTQKEYDERHIVGAVLIPRDKIRERIGAVAADRNTPIYLYCRSGRRADEARRELNGLGYRSVVNLCGIEAAEAALKK